MASEMILHTLFNQDTAKVAGGEMLEGVNKVDWEKLGFPQMPRLLHQIASQDSDAREAAYRTLYADGISELPTIAPHIIPFFIELLRVDEIEDKWALVYLLMEMAMSATSEVEHGTSGTAYGVAALEALNHGGDVYLQFARKPETAENALTLLSYLPSHFGELVPILEAIIEANTSSEMTKTAIKALNRSIASHTAFSIEEQHKYQTLLTSSLLSPDITIRVETTIALIRVLKGDAPFKIELALIDMVMEPNSKVKNYLSELMSVLLRLGVKRAIDAIIYLMPRIEDMRTFFTFTQVLLDLAFNDGIVNHCTISCRYHWVRTYQLLEIQFLNGQNNAQRAEAVHVLTVTQRHVLSWILDVSTIWNVQTNLWELYGLPNSVAGMKLLTSSS